MIKITCDFCGKEDDVRILPSFVIVTPKTLETIKEDVQKALESDNAEHRPRHELLVPEGWVSAPRTVPCNGGPMRAWAACSKEHGAMLEREKRAANQWTDEFGNIPTEHVCGVDEGADVNFEMLPVKRDVQ